MMAEDRIEAIAQIKKLYRIKIAYNINFMICRQRWKYQVWWLYTF